MKYQNRLLAIAVVALSSMLTMPDAYAQDKKFKVGIALPEAQNSFHVMLGKSAVATLKERGIEATLLAANADVNEQVTNLNDLVAAKVDAILLTPVDGEGPAPAVARAHRAGIPVFLVARPLHERFGKISTAFIGLNFDEVGKLKGEWLVANSKPGEVAMLLGPPGGLVMVEQAKSFRTAIEAGKYKVVFAQNSTQTRENGLKLAEDAIVAHPNLVAIYASNDDLALGASQAVKAAGKMGRIAVLGLNGSPPALAAVHKGEMAATVLFDPVAWGKKGAETIADFLQKGKQPEAFMTFPYRMVGQADAYDLIPASLRERLGVTK
ncbi:MAG: substrate-binding domain-containing protein [Burkholderiaceae bacterium]|nr:substrate-binding domain-containing protein [Burkholderiaceae bacterium]